MASSADNPRPVPPQRSGHRRWAGPVAALVVFTVVAYLLHRELAHFHVRNIIGQLHAISRRTLLIAFGCAAASYFALTLYDVLALAYVAKPLRYRRVALVSFIANAFGHNLGFAAFTGAAFRLRMYRLTATDVATISGYISITTTLGLGVLVGLSCLLRPDAAASVLRTERGWALALGAALLAGTAAFFAWCCSRRLKLEIRGWLLRPPGPLLGVAQIALGTADLAITATVLWVLLPHSPTLEFASFVGIFAVAIAAALITHVPGGIGVLEAVLVFALPGVAPDVLLGSLLAYRGVYYLAPLVVASLLFGAEELGAQWARLAQARKRAAALVAPAVPSVVGGLTFVAGAVLLFSGATPALATRLALIARLLPLSVIELAHLASSVIGLALLILARALFRRIRAAYHITWWLLVAGALASLLKGFDYEEAVLMGLVLLVLSLGHNAFYRPASILQQHFTPPWVASVVGVILASIWIGFLAYRHIEYNHQLWWTFALDGHAPRVLRASLVVSILAASYLLTNLLRPVSEPQARAAGVEEPQLLRVLERSGTTLANAALTRDKQLLFSDSGDSFIMYRVQGRSWIALGDPVGPRQEAEELVWRLRELSDQHGGRVALFQTGADYLALYADLGLAAMKIGEEARVPLADFSLEDSQHAELNQARRRGEREHASFEVLPKERVAPMIESLRRISDAWLADRATAEKGFSVGSFSKRYLSHFPLALVRREGEPVAFANLWPTASRDELSVDLMRFGPDAPPGTMDYLFVELLLWARAQGFQRFSLGIAPLVGLESHPLAPAWHRIGNFIFREGEHFYNFEALRRYKAKFHPAWEPRYLVAPGGVALPRILLDAAMLIARGSRK